MTPPEDASVLTWVIDHLWAAAVGLVAVVWGQNKSAMKAIGRKADDALQAHIKEDERIMAAINHEQDMQRGHIGKLFDKLEQHSQRAEDRHRELLVALHTGLSSKADK